MSFASDVEPKPAFLQSILEYRERLEAELAKVNAFLCLTGQQPGSHEPDYPDFLVTGYDDVLDVLDLGGAASDYVH